MTIERSRSYNYKDPNLPAVRKWLTNKLQTALSDAVTSLAREKVKYRFSNVPDNFIWIEYVLTPVDLSGQFLACFSVTRRGYAVADAKLDFTTLDEIIDYFKIPVVKVANYAELFKKIKAGSTKSLYKVTSGSGKYGVVVDNRLKDPLRYAGIIESLGGVSFNVAVNYTGETISVSNPNVGEVSLSWPGFISTTLEAYPLEEIEEIE